MTLDGGWGYILSTVIGVVLAELLGWARRNSDHSKNATDDAHGRIDKFERDFLIYQKHVAEEYVKAQSVDQIRRDIFKVIERLERKVDQLLSEKP